MTATNTNSTWRSKTSTTPAPRPGARRLTASSSASTRPCSMNSIALPSAARSTTASTLSNRTSMPGSKNTTRYAPTRADTASARPPCRLSLTPARSPTTNRSEVSNCTIRQPDPQPVGSCRLSDQVQTSTSHPHALLDPYVSLSAHTAPDVRSLTYKRRQWANKRGSGP